MHPPLYYLHTYPFNYPFGALRGCTLTAVSTFPFKYIIAFPFKYLSTYPLKYLNTYPLKYLSTYPFNCLSNSPFNYLSIMRSFFQA